MKKALLGFAAVAAMLALTTGGPAGAQEEDTSSQTIVEIASANPDFSTLVTAVTEAELAETLSGPGPFTVFAPTNAAFDALPEGTVETLLEDPTGDLADILKLHVVSGAVDSEAAIAAAGGTVETLGGPVSVELEGESLVVGGATVVTADIQASNGIIHVIDAVITEPAAADAGAEPAPTAVESGTSGTAATSAGLSLLAAIGGLAVLGLGGSAFAMARSRRS